MCMVFKKREQQDTVENGESTLYQFGEGVFPWGNGGICQNTQSLCQNRKTTESQQKKNGQKRKIEGFRADGKQGTTIGHFQNSTEKSL